MYPSEDFPKKTKSGQEQGKFSYTQAVLHTTGQ